MEQQGFFNELFGLFKKHLRKKKARPVPKTNIQPDVKVGSKSRDSAHITDTRKQAEMEKLCEKLFQQQDMITSGRLNFIGLDKVRKRYGKSWEGLKHLVYETADSVIRKYMEPGDLFIRYREDVYLIIFARISHEEAHIKATLIAEEIRRRMFEDEREELEGVKIKREVRTVRTEPLRREKGLDNVYDKIFSGDIDAEPKVRKADDRAFTIPEGAKVQVGTDRAKTSRSVKVESNADSEQDNQACSEKISQNVEVIGVDRYQEALGTDQRAAKTTFDPDFCFVPVWDVKRAALSTYICVLETSQSDSDAFGAHKQVYEDLPHKQRLELDKAVLCRTVNELADLRRDGEHFFVCCPVHYETLMRDESFTSYQISCQKIPGNLQSHLFFIVFGCPAQVHRTTLAKFVGPLKNYCRSFCAEVPFGQDVDFVAYRSAGFDALGVDVPQYEKGTDLVIRDLEVFAKQAKKHYIPFIFALGVYSTDIIGSVVFPDFEFSAGAAIHTHVHKPDRAYQFRYQDHFSQERDMRSKHR